jgi:CheY-like chemotaxis protein
MTPETKPVVRHKILLVDDDQAVLDLYRELLEGLPSRPEVFTALSGARGLALLETERFRLLICDLKMAKMDGLQVLSIVRRKFPELRTVALTAVADEQFRSRVYALGVDLFWHKPGTEQETALFLECLESLLGQENDSGFRGVQSKSLVDIVQLECLSQSSSVLRITNGPQTGRIWILEGEVTDADAGDLKGETAFQKILSWRTGTFETLPPEPQRPRAVFKSYNALLLESAQVLDEAANQVASYGSNGSNGAPPHPRSQLSQIEGLEFVLALKPGARGHHEARGLENPERMAAWARQNLEQFRSLGEQLHAGPLEQIDAIGPQRSVSLASRGETDLCVGWVHSVSSSQIRQRIKKVLELWAS